MKRFAVLLIIAFTGIMSAQSPIVVPKRGHAGNIKSLAVSPDNQIIASGGGDSKIRFWSIATGKLLRTLTETYMVRSLSFSPDSKYLISGADDGKVHIYQVETGRRVRSIPLSKPEVAFSPDGKYFVVGNNVIKAKLFSADTTVAECLDEYSSDAFCFAPDGKSYLTSYYCSIGQYSTQTRSLLRRFDLKDTDNEPGPGAPPLMSMIAISRDNKYLLGEMFDSHYEERYALLWSAATGEMLMKVRNYGSDGKIYKSGLLAMAMSPVNNFFATAFAWRPISIYDADSRKEVMKLDNNHYAVTALAFTPDGKKIVAGYNSGAIRMWSLETGTETRTIFEPATFVKHFDITKDGKYLLAQEEYELRLWSLETATPLRRFSGHTEDVVSVHILADQKHFVTASQDSTIRLWSFDNEHPLRTIARHAGVLFSMSVSPDGKYILAGAKDRTAKVWSLETGRQIYSYSGFKYHVRQTAFSSDGNYFAFVADFDADSKKVTICKTADGSEIRSVFPKNGEVTSLAFTPDSKTLLYGTPLLGIQKFDFSEPGAFPSQWIDQPYAGTMEFSHNGKYLAQAAYGGSVIFLRDASTGKQLKYLEFDDQYIEDIRFSEDDRYLFVAFGTSAIHMLDLETNTWVDLLSSGKDDWLVCTNDGYWDSSLNGGSLVDMVRNLESWNIDQFAAQNNRPDLILSRLPHAQKDYIAYLNTLYKKRLRRMGLAESSAKLDYLVPVSKITSLTTSGKSAMLESHLSDPGGHLTSYSIFVNDVPIFGAKGKPVQGREQPIKEKIDLTSGDNKIEVSCTNDQGTESYRDVRYVSVAQPAEPNLYFLAFGVSKYKNASYNLQYADKDANDLSKVFSRLKGKGFKSVNVKVLTNEQVTPEAIRASKNFVKGAKPDDYFVLFIAGHGMHDKDAEATYYFLTSNADVKNLKGTAADFETIEDLLQGIAPRNKLFLMDACESGELDDEDQGQMIAAASGAGMSSRGFKNVSAPSQASDAAPAQAKRSYLYQRDRYIYNDLVRRSGAIVFSSSKGGELSYERSDIKNGLFTSAMLSALSTTVADRDGDGIVSTDELRNYVGAQVANTSGNLQHPTVDRDNIYQKFGFRVK